MQGIWECDAEVESAFREMSGNPKLAQSLAGNCMTGTTVQAACLAALVSTPFVWQNIGETHSGSTSVPRGDDGPERTTASGSLLVPPFRLRRKTARKDVLKKLKPGIYSRRGFGKGNRAASGKKPMATLWQKDTWMIYVLFLMYIYIYFFLFTKVSLIKLNLWIHLIPQPLDDPTFMF